MAGPYTYPTPEMLQAYARSSQSLPGAATPLNTYAPGGAPMVAGPQQRLSFRQRLAIFIAGADAAPVLFPPQQPLQPIAQPADFGALGRPWDYPAGWNTRVTPRAGLEVGFATLKSLADGYDVLRIMIERVKDKVVAQPWNVVPRDRKASRDARCDEVADFLAYPDKVRTFGDWMRMLLEQVIVYDAPAIWLRPTRGGDLYGLEIIDGSLISPKIMSDGRLPPPEYGPAYQQVIKGLPAVDYVQPVPKGAPVPLDPEGQPFPELLYKPKNPRVDSVYGFSAVEQIITTINIALRREAYLLSYYTDGSTPDLIFSTPAEWNPNQIAQFKAWWDSVLAGNLQGRRGTMFVPDGAKPFDVREKALTDKTDEWLTRIMCFALGLNPMPFLQQMNKGQEKTHHDEAAAEGLGPWNRWISDFFGQVIALKFGYRDLEFIWQTDEAIDPLEQADIDAKLVGAKIYHPDELRIKRGDDAMPPEMRLQMDMANYNAAPNSTVLPAEQEQPEVPALLKPPPGAKPSADKAPAPEVAGKLGKGRGGASSRSTRTGRLY